MNVSMVMIFRSRACCWDCNLAVLARYFCLSASRYSVGSVVSEESHRHELPESMFHVNKP